MTTDLDQARSLVIEHQRASISLVQRHLKIGYNAATALMEALQTQGVVSEPGIDGMRRVLVTTRGAYKVIGASQPAAGQLSGPDALPKPPAFRVSVDRMEESHRTTWWVALERTDRRKDAKPWDREGRMTPYMTEKRHHAEETALAYAKFLGVKVDKPADCAHVWVDVELVDHDQMCDKCGLLDESETERLMKEAAARQALRRLDPALDVLPGAPR